MDTCLSGYDGEDMVQAACMHRSERVFLMHFEIESCTKDLEDLLPQVFSAFFAATHFASGPSLLKAGPAATIAVPSSGSNYS